MVCFPLKWPTEKTHTKTNFETEKPRLCNVNKLVRRHGSSSAAWSCSKLLQAKRHFKTSSSIYWTAGTCNCQSSQREQILRGSGLKVFGLDSEFSCNIFSMVAACCCHAGMSLSSACLKRKLLDFKPCTGVLLEAARVLSFQAVSQRSKVPEEHSTITMWLHGAQETKNTLRHKFG